MDELAILEKVIGGTVSAVVILGYGCVVLWRRLVAMDTQHTALIREVLTGLNASAEAMRRTADAVDALREAIERGEHRPPRRAMGGGD